MAGDSFLIFCDICESLTRESSRKALAQQAAEYLRTLTPGDAKIATLFLLGSPLAGSQKLRLGGSLLWQAVNAVAPAKDEAYRKVTQDAVDVGEVVYQVMTSFARTEPQNLSISDVHSHFVRIHAAQGSGSLSRRSQLFQALLKRMTALEAKWAVKIVSGEMRHGLNAGIMLDALALITGAQREKVETAFMFAGAMEEVVEGILRQGPDFLSLAAPRLFMPIRPMLAKSCQTLEEALEDMGSDCALEYKLDGARVQVHKENAEVMLFSRSLRDLTANLPDIAEVCRQDLRAGRAILDGEVIAVGPRDQPLPFQELSRRLTAESMPLGFQEPVVVHLYLFDILSLDSQPLYDRPYGERRRLLAAVAPENLLVPCLVAPDLAAARAFFQAALAQGHEGLVAKHLASTYRPGSRGKHWLKIKKKTTLDLVIVAAEYGYGRRHGWLSNYLLAARDAAAGKFLPVGKTFKGLTDSEFQQMTDRLKSLKISEDAGSVRVKPQIVVEVSFGNVQKSRRYQSGYALRFARIDRLRPDKDPNSIDTVEELGRIYSQEARRKKPS
jgi:DNA ligase-1